MKFSFPSEAPNDSPAKASPVTIQQQPKQPIRLLFSPKKKQQTQRIVFSPETPMISPQQVFSFQRLLLPQPPPLIMTKSKFRLLLLVFLSKRLGREGRNRSVGPNELLL